MARFDRSIECPRCSGGMEPGFIVDEGYGKRTVSKWIEGEPEKGFWTGLNIRGKNQLEVATYRCRRCGYLESYAD